MKKILFKRILISYLILAPLLIISLVVYLSNVVKDNYLKSLKENLLIQANLIAEKLPAHTSSDLDDFCKKYKQITGARLTVIDHTGLVLGDSDQFSSSMDNHLNRPEIQDAEMSGVGSSARFSKTISEDFFYLAISVRKNSNKLFLRLAKPLDVVRGAINTIKLKIIIAAFAGLFIVIFVGLRHTRRITKSIEEITAFSQDVAAGNFKKRIFLEEKGELGELGLNISNMARELNTRLQQSEEEKQKIEAILRNMSDGLILTDTKGLIIMSNSAVSNFFGIKSSIEGKTLMETLRKAELMEAVEEAVRKGQRLSYEIEIHYPDELYLIVTASPFTLKGEISGAVLTFHDITRLKKLEDIRKDFVANVSHEIKTPITAIKGFSETLLEGALDDKDNARKFLETIKNHSERLNSLVNDLLTLSRIELGDIVIEKTPLNINEIIDTVFTTLKDKAIAKGLYLKKEISPEVREIKAERNRLIQILLNLIDNGIKFTDKGGVTVRVKSEKLKVKNGEERDLVTISVEDTGAGIPKKHIQRLGERFYRVDSARSRELGGTGLGLAIVKHLIKAHGWELKVESEEGSGTTINIISPL